MLAILLGVEFFLVFDRTTDSYETRLKENYSMFVVTKKPMELKDFQRLNPHIDKVVEVDKERLATQISKGISQSNSKEILKALPYFYNIKLDRFMSVSELDGVRDDLESSDQIRRVETFGSSYTNSYRLFSFIQFILKVFLGFLGVVSFFLIIKQMEIWKYVHKERMQVMEIFGASLMLRSGVLFRAAILDAILSTVLTSAAFLALKYYWAPRSHIGILIQKQNLLFQSSDFLILLGISLSIVILSVYVVVFSNRD
jgi:cell division transport system permease protein